MKIKLRVVCPQDVKIILRQHAAIAGAFELNAPVFEVEAGSTLFDRIMEATQSTSGLWLNPVMTFTAPEIRQCRFLQPECRGKLLRESKTDYRLNAERLNARPWVSTGPNLRIRWLDRLALTRADIQPNVIAGAGDWTTEYVAGASVFQSFREAGLRGFRAEPVFNPRTRSMHPACHQLVTDNVAPPVLLDATTLPPRATQGVTSFRELGCLTYEELPPGTADFYRTAENWGNHFQPLWIVSARVRECMESHKLRGWVFRPVLEAGSPLHAEYLSVWDSLFASIASNPAHHF